MGDNIELRRTAGDPRTGRKALMTIRGIRWVFIGIIAAALEAVFAATAHAWGPGVHTITALTALSNAGAFLPAVSGLITSFPFEYLYGCLSADFFIGKGRQNPKRVHLHNWRGGFKFLEQANCDRERAYALGFLSHLAADVVAHNFFVPDLMDSFPGKGKMGHLYWELRADYAAGPHYTGVARAVLDMDHDVCDELLNTIVGKRGNGFKTKKRIYMGTVRFSDRFYTTRDFFFPEWKGGSTGFAEHLSSMVEASCILVQDFLKRPSVSPCLLLDPMGRDRLGMLKKKRRWASRFRKRSPVSSRFPQARNLHKS